MITKEQALNSREFHDDHEKGAKITRWRRNGRTQTWKTRPDDFRIPVKYGMYQYGNLNQFDFATMHAVEDCPDNN